MAREGGATRRETGPKKTASVGAAGRVALATAALAVSTFACAGVLGIDPPNDRGAPSADAGGDQEDGAGPDGTGTDAGPDDGAPPGDGRVACQGCVTIATNQTGTSLLTASDQGVAWTRGSPAVLWTCPTEAMAACKTAPAQVATGATILALTTPSIADPGTDPLVYFLDETIAGAGATEISTVTLRAGGRLMIDPSVQGLRSLAVIPGGGSPRMFVSAEDQGATSGRGIYASVDTSATFLPLVRGLTHTPVIAAGNDPSTSPNDALLYIDDQLLLQVCEFDRTAGKCRALASTGVSCGAESCQAAAARPNLVASGGRLALVDHAGFVQSGGVFSYSLTPLRRPPDSLPAVTITRLTMNPRVIFWADDQKEIRASSTVSGSANLDRVIATSKDDVVAIAASDAGVYVATKGDEIVFVPAPF
jgi:hypothetical protein